MGEKTTIKEVVDELIEYTDKKVLDSLENFVGRIILLSHPIGSYYWSEDSTNPADLFGGKWIQIKDRFVYAVGDSADVGTTGGEETHTLTVDETPAHTHTKGTMNITGDIDGTTTAGYQFLGDKITASGAFSTTGNNTKSGIAGDSTNTWGVQHLTFNATSSWTGETSEVGGGQSHNNMPPYVKAYCWKRTA